LTKLTPLIVRSCWQNWQQGRNVLASCVERMCYAKCNCVCDECHSCMVINV